MAIISKDDKKPETSDTKRGYQFTPEIDQKVPAINDLKAELERLRTISQGRTKTKANFLILGDKGVGKSVLLRTCQFPVLVDSFDPNGMSSDLLQKDIKAGNIVVDSSFEGPAENETIAEVFRRWEITFISRRNSGFFNLFKTYAIDSYTSWSTSLLRALGKSKWSSDGIPEIKAYGICSITQSDYIRLFNNLPCHFITFGHVEKTLIQATGKMLLSLESIPSLKVAIPLLFDELYMMTIENDERYLWTHGSDSYAAATRIGGSVFQKKEKADISYLLRKAGYLQEK